MMDVYKMQEATDWTIERDAARKGVEANSAYSQAQWWIPDIIIEPLVKFFMTSHLREWFVCLVKKYE